MLSGFDASLLADAPEDEAAPLDELGEDLAQFGDDAEAEADTDAEARAALEAARTKALAEAEVMREANARAGVDLALQMLPLWVRLGGGVTLADMRMLAKVWLVCDCVTALVNKPQTVGGDRGQRGSGGAGGEAVASRRWDGQHQRDAAALLAVLYGMPQWCVRVVDDVSTAPMLQVAILRGWTRCMWRCWTQGIPPTQSLSGRWRPCSKCSAGRRCSS